MPSLLFLSTLPARGATAAPRADLLLSTCYFYPRSPRGERPATLLQGLAGDTISIHAPREGSDPVRDSSSLSTTAFLSTLPARGATVVPIAPCDLGKQISIHAPREGSDPPARPRPRTPSNFYPRSPRGERPYTTHNKQLCRKDFYPRSPRGERQSPGLMVWLATYFYPRSPRGERPARRLPS